MSKKITLEQFYAHTMDSTLGHLLLKKEALEIIEPIFESFPFLRYAIHSGNPYRIHVEIVDFELFFLPAMKYCGIIDDYVLR